MKTVGKASDWLLGKLARRAEAQASTPCVRTYCKDTYYWSCRWFWLDNAQYCACFKEGRCV